VEVVCMMAF
jgi:hypothetical protein